jgi:hypothetical protein
MQLIRTQNYFVTTKPFVFLVIGGRELHHCGACPIAVRSDGKLPSMAVGGNGTKWFG